MGPTRLPWTATDAEQRLFSAWVTSTQTWFILAPSALLETGLSQRDPPLTRGQKRVSRHDLLRSAASGCCRPVWESVNPTTTGFRDDKGLAPEQPSRSRTRLRLATDLALGKETHALMLRGPQSKSSESPGVDANTNHEHLDAQ